MKKNLFSIVILLGLMVTTSSCNLFNRDAKKKQQEVQSEKYRPSAQKDDRELSKEEKEALKHGVQPKPSKPKEFIVQEGDPCDGSERTPTNSAGKGLEWACEEKKWKKVRPLGKPLDPKPAPKDEETSSDDEPEMPEGITGTTLADISGGAWGIQLFASSSLQGARDEISRKDMATENVRIIDKNGVFVVVWVPANYIFSREMIKKEYVKPYNKRTRNKFHPLGTRKGPFLVEVTPYLNKMYAVQ